MKYPSTPSITTTTETTTVTTTSIIPTTTTVVTTISTTANTTTVTETTRLQTCVTTTQGETRITTCFSPSITTTTVTTAKCSITGQPAGIFLRILSDSTLKPLTGAVVKVTHNPAGCNINGVMYVTPSITQTFTTNGTEWVPLDSTDGGKYSFIVNYSGRNYTLTANLSPLTLTCTTLYVPSGRVNNTESAYKSTCT